MFTGGDQTGEWENKAFVAQHVAGRGALGEFFTTLLQGGFGPQPHPNFIEVLGSTAIHHCHRTLAGAEEDGPVMSSSCWRIDPRCGKSACALCGRSRV